MVIALLQHLQKFDILKFKVTLSVFISYFPPYECLFPTALTSTLIGKRNKAISTCRIPL